MKYIKLYTKLIVITLLLIVYNKSFAAVTSVETITNPCDEFNKLAAQFSLAHNNMQSPLSLEQLQSTLGRKKPESISTITTYTWTYNNRTLLISAINSNIEKRILTGRSSDGSPISKKMDELYAKSQSQTSIWFTKEIRNQLGQEQVTRSQLQNYKWECGAGYIEVTVDNKDTIIATSSRGSDSNQIAIKRVFT